MKTTYLYIKFEKRNYGSKYGETCWNCINKKSGDMLGLVSYYPTWKQWVFTQSVAGIVFSASCLRDIAEFLDALNGIAP